MGQSSSSSSNDRIHPLSLLEKQQQNSHSEPLLAQYNIDDDKLNKNNRHPSLSTIIFQVNSFMAVLWPVLITMLISTWMATGIQDPATAANMQTYLYYKSIESSVDSTSVKTIQALTNALLIICFIAFITFAVVLLYKFNLMRGLSAYLICSSTILLGMVGSVLATDIIVDKWNLPIDTITMNVGMYNFAIVGTLSIFYQKGIPSVIERAYLVATSVIMAWQLCQWPEWSVWTILVLLAFWDLFAVLTPCGPLRCLVEMISTEGRPMPGLLYEASVTNQHIDSSSLYHRKQRRSTTTHLEQELREFYATHNPSNAHQVELLAEVYACRQDELWEALHEKYNTDPTIKLGLGDFIFYSVLVSRAAMNDFVSFTACLVCIVLGLAITMYLLTMYNALPALPISIILGSLMYAACQVALVPFVNEFCTSSIIW